MLLCPGTFRNPLPSLRTAPCPSLGLQSAEGAMGRSVAWLVLTLGLGEISMPLTTSLSWGSVAVMPALVLVCPPWPHGLAFVLSVVLRTGGRSGGAHAWAPAGSSAKGGEDSVLCSAAALTWELLVSSCALESRVTFGVCSFSFVLIGCSHHCCLFKNGRVFCFWRF